MADDNTIDIKVTATTDGLQSGLASASKQVDSFGDDLNTLAARAQAIKPDAFKEVAEALNAGKIDLDEFRDGLIGITTAQSAAANEAVNLAEKSTLSSGALRELTVVGRELASGNLTRLPGSLSILAQRLGGIPPSAILATAAIAAVGYAIYEAIDSSEKFEADLAKIQNAFTAVGAGNQFDRTEITQYLADLRQIPGVTEEAATSIVNELSRANNGTKLLSETTRDLKPLADTLGIEVPAAAKLLASALNDPAKAIQELRGYGIELTASQQEEVRQFMAVNDVASAQRVVLDALAASTAHVVDTSTALQHLGQDLRNSFSGVNESVDSTSSSLDRLAAKLAGFGPAGAAFAASAKEISEANRLLGDRNVPNAGWSGGSGTMAGGDSKQAQEDRSEQIRKENEQITETNKRYETGNSLLAEQEAHKHNLAVIQHGIDAAEDLGDQEALKRATIDLEQENKRYYGEPKEQKDDTDKVEEAQVKAAAEGAQARIKTKQEEVEEEERLGQISSDQAIKQLRALEAQEHQINLKRIADMRSVYEQKGDRAGVASSVGDSEKENERDKQANDSLDSRGADATRKTQQAEMDGARRVADETVRTAQVANAQKVALGEMSAQDEIQAEIEAANQKHALDDAYYASQLQHEAMDSAAYQKTLADKLVAEQKFQQQVLQLNTKLTLEKQQQEQQLTRSITNGLNQTVNGVLTGTQTMGQAFQRLGQNIVLSLVEGALDKIVQKVLENNTTIEAAQTALNAFLEFIGLASANTQEKTTTSTAQGQIDAYAAVGAAAAAASAAGGGPAAAAAAGAATFGIIESFQIAEVASAAGGMIVGGDQLAMVHENEMVLPARYTSGLTKMIDGANAGQGGSGHTFNNTFHVNAGDGVTAKQLPDMIVKTMSKAMRNGQFGGMRTV